jgi:polysaccharide biosynthesis protein PslJ
MDTVTLGTGSRADAVAGIAIVLVCPLLVVLAVSGGLPGKLALVGLVAVIVSIYIGVRHPLWLYWGFAVVLGALPFGYFPGVHIPLYLPFAAGVLLAAIMHPNRETPYHPLEKAVVLLILASGVSVVFTAHGIVDLAVYVRWIITTLVMIALLRLSRENLARFGRIYVYAATINALFGIAIVVADPNHRFISILHIFDYDREATGRFVFTGEGENRFSRLGGTWVDPNMAGIGLVPALVMGMVLLKGKMRVAVTSILSVAILLTLSRAAIFSVLVGVILVGLFHTMRARTRLIMLGSIVFVVAGALMVPAIRTRIASSFGADDQGAQDRTKSLLAWPGQMTGHWPFGLGWGRREFVDGAYAFQLNFVSNSPLIAIYRAGIIAGLIFIAVLVMGCIMGARALRSDSLPAAMYGGVFIGFCVVALNLDHPVVDIPQSVAAFSVFLTFLVYVDRSRQRPDPLLQAPTNGSGMVTTPSHHYALQ